MKNLLKTILMAIMMASSSSVWAVNINTGNAQNIADDLNGIGLKKAEAIVAWRGKNGNFKDLASLTQVKGIGQKTVEKNKELIQF